MKQIVDAQMSTLKMWTFIEDQNTIFVPRHAFYQSIKIGGVIWASTDEDVDEEIITKISVFKKDIIKRIQNQILYIIVWLRKLCLRP